MFHCQTLPDQQHAYYLRDVGESSLDQTAKMVSRVPFTHPTNVANILNLLRRQLLFNTIISSCIRPYAKQGQSFIVTPSSADVYDPTQSKVSHL